ncbi:threonine--tRNA ligase [Candidatus Campbellbacteria bacterium]|nr:threonine--tRNA ligase [Candidatus Campbellbacteria bacterium]|tara:strand:+ start:5653 stop:7395 length:1743 start_codon:yes stop_codon:yes gene_type:complete
MTHIEKKRHSIAHLLAAATLKLYPDTKITLGPAIEHGFYYDMEFSNTISDSDLKKIQKTMKKMANSWSTFESKEVSPNEAREFFAGNEYKLELIDEIEKKGEPITLYTSGDFTDLCRGGHVENFKEEIDMNAFKLDRVAGAYWRGDENNPMLTRIYGLAFDTKEELDEYLQQRDEAKKRDHRKIGKELGLFTFSEKVGPGLPLFTPKGTKIRDLVVDKIDRIQSQFGYEKVCIPHITKSDLYKTSGHWDKYKDDLFHVKGKSDAEFVMKPMNCPHHTQVYDAEPRSYRDLPLRYAETTMVYRDEQAGELMGLSRVRSISQDDGHIFCTPDHIKQEVNNIVSIIKEFYTAMDMFNDGDYWVSLSVRDSQDLDKYIGDDELWDKAEIILEDIAKENNLHYKRVEGEAAFYGPKLDFQFKDALGREWQLGTAQLDFVQPARFELEYTDNEGNKQTPVMIHRAVAGSLERFMALSIEHFAGYFPLWLAPLQIAIIPIKPDIHGDYAETIRQALQEAGARVELWDDDHDGFGKKVRRAKNEKIPYWIIIGDEETDSKTLTIESKNGQQKNISMEEFVASIQDKLK